MMSDLRPVHVDTDKKFDPNNTAKITGGVIVLLGILALGGYGYSTGAFHSQPVPDSRLPQASLPHNMPNS
jgi:hypothetical protein